MIPTSTSDEADQEECHMTFSGHPAYDALLGRIESDSQGVDTGGLQLQSHNWRGGHHRGQLDHSDPG